MTDKKISELDAITGSNTAATDVFVVVDTSTGQTKKITREELNNAIEQDVLSSIDIDTINGDFTVNGDINLGDNDKAIFGADSNLQIYHDGANTSYISTAAGNMVIEDTDGGTVFIRGKSGENSIIANDDNSVRIFFDNSEKLATTSTGIDVTGTVTADGLTTGGVFSFDNSGFNGEIKTYGSGTGIIYDALNGYHTFRENGTARMQIRAGGDIYLGYEDTGTTAKLFWDASAESLGIGTSNPRAALDFGSDYYSGTPSTLEQLINKVALFTDGSGPKYGLGISDGALNITAGANGDIRLHTNGANERVRIDSSGNAMLAKSSTNTLGTVGHDFGVTGYAMHTRASSNVLYLNRTTSDGNIAEFYKDGTTVGSIGVASGDLNINGGASHSGIRFQATGLYPLENGTTSSGEIDLGAAGSKFKNLYLSGGVYLGGTGSANKLEDYEEGTWTPTGGGNVSGISSQNGHYTKVGNLVTIAFELVATPTSTTSNMTFGGIPFTAADHLSSTNVGATGIAYEDDSLFTVWVNETTNTFFIELDRPLQGSASSAAKKYRGTLTYFAS